MTPFALEYVLRGAGAALRGALPPQTVFASIERDARQAKPGDLFIALRGERFDGHDFVGDAAAAGAAAALVSQEWADAQSDVSLPLLIACGFARSEGNAERPKLCCARRLRRVRVDVDQIHNLEPHVARGDDRRPKLCFQQSARDSALPEINILSRFVSDRSLHQDVTDL